MTQVLCLIPECLLPFKFLTVEDTKMYVNKNKIQKQLENISMFGFIQHKAAKCQNIYVALGTSETDNMPGS